MSTGGKPLSLVNYYGGQASLVQITMPHIQKMAETCGCNGYAELTGGGGRILLNLPPYRFSYKLYNEYDAGLCALFACVQDEALVKKLITVLNNLPYEKEIFTYAVNNRNNPDILKSAALTFISLMMSFNNNMRNFKHMQGSKYLARATRYYYHRINNDLMRCHHALKGVEITNGDFRNILEPLGDSHKIIKFIDPPFHPVTLSTDPPYPGKMTVADHIEMVDILVKSHCWILRGYDPLQYGCTDYIRLEETGAQKVSLGHRRRASTGRVEVQSERKEEIIWVKY